MQEQNTVRIGLVSVLVMGCISASAATVADAPPKAAQQSIIEKAIQAYASKRQADEERARDQLIANHMPELVRDFRTPVIGNPNGNVTITEFFDYTCPYCKAVEPRLEKLLKDDSRVKLVLKEFPILTPESLVAAKAALAAQKQGKYPQFHMALMNFRGRMTEEVVFDTAKEVGLDIPRLRRDMDSPYVSDEIIATFNLARAIRVFQTPGFIVGMHMLTGPSAEIDFAKAVAAERVK